MKDITYKLKQYLKAMLLSHDTFTFLRKIQEDDENLKYHMKIM